MQILLLLHAHAELCISTYIERQRRERCCATVLHNGTAARCHITMRTKTKHSPTHQSPAQNSVLYGAQVGLPKM